ncbi:MAG: MATE family efflux transporter [Pyramidobacter sp.]|nr:MATE family efflux transporter [Pyramidobacter sp.]
MNAQPTLMTQGPIWKRIVFFAMPLFFGNLFQQLYNTVDSLVVGNFIGSEALAAVSSSGNLIQLLIGLIQGVFIGAGVVISRYYGARDSENVGRAIHTMVAFALLAGIALSVFGVAFTPSILRLMRTPESVLPNSTLYFRIYFGGILALMMYNCACGILQAVGDSRHPLFYLLVSSGLNVALDLLFVIVFGWGIAGVGIATVISQAFSAALSYWHLCHTRMEHRVVLSQLRLDARTLRQILHAGLPTGVQNSIISFANVIVQSHINSFGAMAMAGCGTYAKLEGFGFLPIGSFALAMGTFIGQNLGARAYDRALKGSRFAIVACVVLAECIAGTIYIFAPTLISWFNSEEHVIAYGVMQARTITPFYFILAASHCIAGILRGAGKAIVPMVVMMVCWCFIRIAYLEIILWKFNDIKWLFRAYPITWTLSTTVFLIYYFKADWLHAYDKRA